MNKAKCTDGHSGMRFRFSDQFTTTLWQESKRKDEAYSLPEEENLRNVNCRHYEACLNTAALANVRDLGCEDCLFKTDNTYKMTEGDFDGLLRLYRAIKA
jgi:hypothetical protein